jgi:hypothetical protein
MWNQCGVIDQHVVTLYGGLSPVNVVLRIVLDKYGSNHCMDIDSLPEEMQVIIANLQNYTHGFTTRQCSAL